MTLIVQDEGLCPSFTPLQEAATFLGFSWELFPLFNHNVSMLSTGSGTFNLPSLFTDRQSEGNTQCVDYMRLGGKHTTNALSIFTSHQLILTLVLKFGEGEEFWVESKQIYEEGPQTLVPQHAQLHIEPDVNNGALRLQIREYGADGIPAHPGSPEFVMQADALDFRNPGAIDSGAPAFSWQPDEVRRRILIGQTELANIDFVDEAKNGAGIIADTISDPAGPFKGGEYSMPKGDCMAFIRELQRKIFPDQPLNAEFDAWYNAKVDYLGYDTPPQTLKVASMKVEEWGNKDLNKVTRYSIQEHNKLKVEFSNQAQGSDETFWDGPSWKETDTKAGTKRKRILEPWEEQKAPALSTWNGAPMRDPTKLQGDACRRLRRSSLHHRCSSASTPAEQAGSSELAMTRVNKVTSIINVIKKDAAAAAGAAGVALGAAFVILDFVNGNWVGGGFGAAVRRASPLFGSVAD